MERRFAKGPDSVHGKPSVNPLAIVGKCQPWLLEIPPFRQYLGACLRRRPAPRNAHIFIDRTPNLIRIGEKIRQAIRQFIESTAKPQDDPVPPRGSRAGGNR